MRKDRENKGDEKSDERDNERVMRDDQKDKG